MAKKKKKCSTEHEYPHSWRFSQAVLVKHNCHMLSGYCLPFLSYFCIGQCRPQAGRSGYCCSGSEAAIFYTGNDTVRTLTATFPNNPAISKHWEVWQGRLGKSPNKTVLPSSGPRTKLLQTWSRHGI